MGLDMYLTGRKYMGYGSSAREEDGFEIEEITVKLGYWRKHPDLHGYIVGNFGPEIADGKQVQASCVGEDGVEREDNCDRIELGLEALNRIVEAIKGNKLAKGQKGFFFGNSPQADNPDDKEEYERQKAEDLEIFGKAAAFLANINTKEEKGAYKSIEYRASW